VGVVFISLVCFGWFFLCFFGWVAEGGARGYGWVGGGGGGGGNVQQR